MSDERHWRCPSCGTFDGPMTLGICDVCEEADDGPGPTAVEVMVPAFRLAEVEQEWDRLRAAIDQARRIAEAPWSPEGRHLQVEAIARALRGEAS